MAISPFKTWIPNEVLTAADLNNSFLHLTNNAEAAVFPATTAHDMNGFQLILDADADTGIIADSDDQIEFILHTFRLFRFVATGGAEVNGLDFIAGDVAEQVQIAAISDLAANVSVDIVPKGVGDIMWAGTPLPSHNQMVLGDRVFN
jgi:hypothetical protein